MTIHNEIYIETFRKSKMRQFGKIEITFLPFPRTKIAEIFKIFRINIKKIKKSLKEEKFMAGLYEKDGEMSNHPYFCILSDFEQNNLKLDESIEAINSSKPEISFSKEQIGENKFNELSKGFRKESHTGVSDSFQFYVEDKVGKVVFFMLILIAKIIWINCFRKNE